MTTRLRKMLPFLGAALAVSFVVTAIDPGPADAAGQWRGWGDFFPKLTESDLDMVHSAAREDMTGKPVGTKNLWENPESGNSGSVQLLSVYQWEGYDCRKVLHFLQFPEAATQVWEVTLCDIDGEWKWPVPPERH
jgi:hypothetical protein